MQVLRPLKIARVIFHIQHCVGNCTGRHYGRQKRFTANFLLAFVRSQLGHSCFPKWSDDHICTLFVLTMRRLAPILLTVGVYELSQVLSLRSHFPVHNVCSFDAEQRRCSGSKEIYTGNLER